MPLCHMLSDQVEDVSENTIENLFLHIQASAMLYTACELTIFTPLQFHIK